MKYTKKNQEGKVKREDSPKNDTNQVDISSASQSINNDQSKNMRDSVSDDKAKNERDPKKYVPRRLELYGMMNGLSNDTMIRIAERVSDAAAVNENVIVQQSTPGEVKSFHFDINSLDESTLADLYEILKT